MADAATVHIGENSPEQVAFKLMNAIANCEGKTFHKNASGDVVSKEWILKTYAQCLHVVRNPSYVGDALNPAFGQ